MRHSLPAALVAILFSVQAAAQEEDEKEEAPAGSLAGGSDPVDSETSDEGRFTPKGKTGKLKEKKRSKEKVEKIEEIQRKQINLTLDLLAAWGTPPEPDAQPVYNRDESVTAFGTVIGGTYDLDPKMSLGLRIPWSRADLEATRLAAIAFDGTSSALGNPEVMFQYRIKQSPGFYLPIDLGIGFPLAQGNPDPTTTDHPGAATAMTNRSMDAGTGWRDSELYYVGRVPIKMGFGALLQRTDWNLYGGAKLVVAPKLRGELNDPNVLDFPAQEVESYDYNPAAIRALALGSGAYNVWSGLWLGLDAWVVADFIHEVVRESAATPPDLLQLVLEPRLAWDFGIVKVTASYIEPVGGVLQDIQGARLRAEAGF